MVEGTSWHPLFKYNLKYPKGCQLLQIVVSNKNERHHIHHNLFKNIPEGSGNGFETLQLDPPPGASNTVIEDNFLNAPMGRPRLFQLNQTVILSEEIFLITVKVPWY